MTGSPTPAAGIGPAHRARFLSTVCASALDFWTLTKPEVNFLIVIATFAGFYLGSPRNLASFPLARLFQTLWGTLLVASGTGTLNQYLEFRFDAQMRRTCKRPIPAGRLHPAAALWFGVSLSVIGIVYLYAEVNALASLLAAFTLTTYLALYTPLKRKTALCTFVGAIPGAMPPLIGWAAASGSIGSETAWSLYAVLFLWQFPHFMAIAWMYREDYARAGYMILPATGDERFLTWVTSIPSLTLFIVVLRAMIASNGGALQYSAAIMLGSGLFYFAMRQVFLHSKLAARQLLKATIVYLPLQFLLLVLGKR
jgi:protoheme IX farnesyltransferase